MLAFFDEMSYICTSNKNVKPSILFIMKKVVYLVAALVLAPSMLSSCWCGSFSATNACWDFNRSLTSNKIVNGIVSFVIGPFEASIGGFLDVVLLNTIEFWTGSNPLAATTLVQASDGQYYAIASDKKGGYIITNQETKQKVALLFEPETHTWTASFDGKEIKLCSLESPEVADIYAANGDVIRVD